MAKQGIHTYTVQCNTNFDTCADTRENAGRPGPNTKIHARARDTNTMKGKVLNTCADTRENAGRPGPNTKKHARAAARNTCAGNDSEYQTQQTGKQQQQGQGRKYMRGRGRK